MTPEAFKRSIRDLQVWCSSCMVAFSGSDPIGVLIGAKRPSGTLIHRIAVHPDHRRQGHGRHLLTSLSSKLAILGPPRIVAEVPESLAPACELFGATGYVQEAILTDYVLQHDERIEVASSRAKETSRVRDPCHGRRSRRQRSSRRRGPTDVLGALGRDPHGTERRHLRPCRRLRRAHRGLRSLYGPSPDGGDYLVAHVRRGRRSPSEAIGRSTRRARHAGLPVPQGPSVGNFSRTRGGARFPPSRRASALRRAGPARIGQPARSAAIIRP